MKSFYLKSIKDYLFDDLLVMKSNPHYRLGDIILQVGGRWKHDYNIILNSDKFKNTILKNYIEFRNQSEKIDYKQLKFAIVRNSHLVTTHDTILYINIRMGDIVTNREGLISVKDAVGIKRNVFLYNNIKLINQVSNVLNIYNNINRIEIISALHFGDNKIHNRFFYSVESVEENRKLFNEMVIELMRKFKLPVGIYHCETNDQIQLIDKHIMMLCLSKHVIVDEGGFGKVIKIVRNLINH